MKSLQETYAPKNSCFGCGPANAKGLRIRSFVEGDALLSGSSPNGSSLIICDFQPEPHHQAFGGVLNGGIIGTLLDCHSNWTAAYHLMKNEQLPCTVTAEFHVKLRRPTPMDQPVRITAKPTSIDGDKAVISATLEAGGRVTATCTGVFVAVKEGQPAFHRW